MQGESVHGIKKTYTLAQILLFHESILLFFAPGGGGKTIDVLTQILLLHESIVVNRSLQTLRTTIVTFLLHLR